MYTSGQGRAGYPQRLWAFFVRPVTEWRRPSDAPGHKRLLWTRLCYWDRVCGAVAGVLVLYLLLARVLYADARYGPGSFRASRPVRGALDSALADQLREQAAQHPDWPCGCGAPQLRVYVQALALRQAGQPPVVMVNPSLELLEPESQLSVEQSPLCSSTRVRLYRTRSPRVRVFYADESDSRVVHTQVLEGPQALCLQHWVEVFGGVWPCEGSEHTHDILRLPPAPSPAP